MLEALAQVLLLGLVEGLTEFLPVSSTGHLILVGHFLGYQDEVFDIVIQLGAILAVCVVFFGRLWRVTLALPHDPGARRFALAVIVAFLPAAVVGALAHDFIEEQLLSSELVVCLALILGGIAILVIERLQLRPRIFEVEQLDLATALKIGCFQVIAMIPGVSRSGATILGALLVGVDRRAAAEFSFFVAIPTMLGATVYTLYKNRHALDLDNGLLIAVGFVMAFLSALVVVRGFVAFVGRHGFSPFGWYRIVLGAVLLYVLYG